MWATSWPQSAEETAHRLELSKDTESICSPLRVQRSNCSVNSNSDQLVFSAKTPDCNCVTRSALLTLLRTTALGSVLGCLPAPQEGFLMSSYTTQARPPASTVLGTFILCTEDTYQALKALLTSSALHQFRQVIFLVAFGILGRELPSAKVSLCVFCTS